MNKTLRIAWHEFATHVLRRRFIGALLGPLLILLLAVAIGAVTVAALSKRDAGTIGVVDPQQSLMTTSVVMNDVTFERFADVDAARQALQSERIAAYYELADDFNTTGRVSLFYWQQAPNDALQNAFEKLVRLRLLNGTNTQVTTRVIDGSTFALETLDGSRKFGENSVASFLLPIVMGILFLIALMSGTQYLMQAIVDEKENRTIEIMVTSVSPTQLMVGKVLGLGGLGLFQVLVWLLSVVVALAVAGVRLPFLREVNIQPGFIAVALIMFVLNYLLLGAIMVAIGAAVTDVKQAQTFASPFVMLAVAPEFFIPVLLFNPNGIIAVILSLFPLTSPLAMVLRYGITQIPAWQIAASLGLMALAAAGAFWLAGRIFRMGMLRIGQRLSLSEMAAAIRF